MSGSNTVIKSQEQQSVSYDSELDFQNKISEAYDNVKSTKIISSKVIKCSVAGKYARKRTMMEFRINSKKKFNARFLKSSGKVIKKSQIGEKGYAIVYKFKYADKKYTIIDRVYENYDFACKQKKDVGEELQFNFFQNDMVKKHNVPNSILKNKLIFTFFTFSSLSKIILPVFGILMMFSIIQELLSMQIVGNPDVSSKLAIMVFTGPITIGCILSVIENYIWYDNTYSEIQENTFDNILDNTPDDTPDDKCNYKSIKAKYNITDKKLVIYPYEIDGKWTFPRNGYGQLSKEGRSFVNNINGNSDDECAFTVKDDGDEKSGWRSSCGKWWIVEQSL